MLLKSPNFTRAGQNVLCLSITKSQRYNKALYRFYNSTIDLLKRILKHNKDDVSYISKYRPWKITVYIVFEDKTKALNFEQYFRISLREHSQKNIFNIKPSE